VERKKPTGNKQGQHYWETWQ